MYGWTFITVPLFSAWTFTVIHFPIHNIFDDNFCNNSRKIDQKSLCCHALRELSRVYFQFVFVKHQEELIKFSNLLRILIKCMNWLNFIFHVLRKFCFVKKNFSMINLIHELWTWNDAPFFLINKWTSHILFYQNALCWMVETCSGISWLCYELTIPTNKHSSPHFTLLGQHMLFYSTWNESLKYPYLNSFIEATAQ